MRTSRDRLIATALLLPIGVAVAFSIARLALEAGDVPDDDDLAAAAAHIAEQKLDDDDAIAVLPPWSLRPLLALQEHSARVVASDGPWWQLTRGRVRRLLVLREPDAEPWLAHLDLPPAASTTTFGVVTVTAHDAGGPALFDFRERLGDATVDVGAAPGGGERQPCSEPVRGGVHCGGRPAWLRVAREWALVTENGSDVVAAHPPKAGEALTLSWVDVDVGASLVVAAGHTRDAAQRASAAVRLTVRIDDDVAATIVRRPSFVVEPSRAALRAAFVATAASAGGSADGSAGGNAGGDDGEGFRVSVVDTARWAGARHRVSFMITTDDEASNDFAFDAFIPRASAADTGAAP